MNLWDRKISGLLLLAVLFLLACEDPNEIGLELGPGDDSRVNVKYQVLNLPLKAIRYDSLNTTRTNRMSVGRVNDPVLGSLYAESYTQIRFSDQNDSIPPNATLDSMVFTMRLAEFYGENFSSPYSIELHQLQDTLFGTEGNPIIYRSSRKTPFSAEVLGSASFSPNPAVDTPTLRFQLSESFQAQVFQSLKDRQGAFATQQAMHRIFKGFALVASDDSEGILSLAPYQQGSEWEVYFSTPDSGEDTLRHGFRFQAMTHYTHLDQDFSGTEFENIEARQVFEPSGSHVVSQSTSLIYAVIDFNPLKQFSDSLGRIIVNRSEMRIGRVEDPISPFKPAPRQIRYLLLDELDNSLARTSQSFSRGSNQAILTQESYLSGQQVQVAVDSLNRENRIYVRNTTSFAQFLVDGVIRRRRAIIFPSPGTSFGRLELEKGSVTLEIYYTSID